MRRTLGLLVLLVLVACGPPPKPFAHAPRSDNPLLEMESATVMVGPIFGGGEGVGATLTQAMIEGLSQAEIPAVPYRENRATGLRHSSIRAMLTETPGQGGLVKVAVTWAMFDRSGAEMGRRIMEIELDSRAWARGASSDIAALIGDAPTRFAALVLEDPGRIKEPPPPPMVRVEPVTGAPGGGNAELTGAMAGLLRMSGVEVSGNSPNAPAPDFLIKGDVEVKPRADGMDDLRIAWVVTRPNGEELGAVDMANPVPHDSIKEAWGPLALDIARGSAEGVIRILNRYPLENK